MEETRNRLESRATRRFAVPVRSGLGLVSLVARYRIAAACPRERQFRPKRIHTGNARTPDRNWTPNRMIVTTINPPKPVASLSLNIARPLFPRIERVVVICPQVQFTA